jgi:hypothetical protein
MALSNKFWGQQQPYGCPYCGSPHCIGGCVANPVPPGMQAVKSLFDAQQVAPQKPLPEEEIFCATGGLVGWREWRVPCFGNKLLSFNGTVWPVREPLRATCKKALPTECLGHNCACGLYAWKDRKDLKVNQAEFSCISGEVWLWGKVVEHEKGYRAEFSYPKAFVNSGADARRLGQIYGVKLI